MQSYVCVCIMLLLQHLVENFSCVQCYVCVCGYCVVAIASVVDSFPYIQTYVCTYIFF